jgi:hypothetical protein
MVQKSTLRIIRVSTVSKRFVPVEIVEIVYLEDYNNDELVARVTNIVIRKLDKK